MKTNSKRFRYQTYETQTINSIVYYSSKIKYELKNICRGQKKHKK